MSTNNITVENQTFDKSNTLNPDTPDGKTDGLSVLCFSNSEVVKVNNCVIDGQDARWGAKMSLCFKVEYNNCVFKNGTARSFDMVRGGSLTFNDCKFENNGVRKVINSPYSLTEVCDIGIKGGVRDVTFNSCEFNDILLGDYSIYDQANRLMTRRFNFVNCKNKDGGAIVIRGRHFDNNSLFLLGTSAKKFVWPTLLTKIYWAYNRKFGDTRKPEGWNVTDPRELD